MTKKIDLKNLDTEQRNINSLAIDQKDTFDILAIINDEDALIAQVIKKELSTISKVVDLIFEKYQQGGRLIYIGAGSSGRIGVLDASEMLPTYGVATDRIFAIIAGGDQALKLPQEGVEDDELLAIDDLQTVGFNSKDILIGIAASGRTPYVMSALRYCQTIGGLALGLSMTTNSQLRECATEVININTGPEVITGSTRMKAGTATKLVLNMISTALMVKCGKVYQNLMVDMIVSNEKLQNRATRMVKMITQADEKTVLKVLSLTNFQCKPAIIMLLKNVDYSESLRLLEAHHGNLNKIL